MKMKSGRFSLVRLAVATMLAVVNMQLSAASAQPLLYDAVGDFSTNSNPNGAWSYLWSTNLGDVPRLLSRRSAPFSSALWITRWDNNVPQPNWCGVGANHGTNTFSQGTVRYQPDTLLMDPQSCAVVVRFTPPNAGSYQVTGLFRLNDTAPRPHSVQVRRNNTQILFAQNTTGGVFGTEYPFDLTATNLSANETLEFIVSRTGTYTYLSTGLKLTISKAGLRLVQPQGLGTHFTFSFQTVTNTSYSVEYTDDLYTTNWNFLEALNGNGSLMQYVVPMTNGAQRFFRMRTP